MPGPVVRASEQTGKRNGVAAQRGGRCEANDGSWEPVEQCMARTSTIVRRPSTQGATVPCFARAVAFASRSRIDLRLRYETRSAECEMRDAHTRRSTQRHRSAGS